MNALIEIQNELKAPKNQYNSFGKYKYRSCEDILEAVKPLLKEKDLRLTISDEVKEVCGFAYVESTATICNSKGMEVATKAQAGIEKAAGMSLAQSFGSSSSYARKYALNGLFLIDDTKDADATNDHGKDTKTKPQPSKVVVKEDSKEFLAIVDWIINGKENAKGEVVFGTIEKAKQAYSISDDVEASLKEKIVALQEIA
jgi:hypothetical protein